jgi:hypothetical protein
MKRFNISFLIICLLSCSPDLEVLVPSFGDNSNIDETNPIPEAGKLKMDGVYKVLEGSDQFGSQVVLKWNGKYLSVFGERDAAYFVLQGGSLESVLFFVGYWLYAKNT